MTRPEPNESGTTERQEQRQAERPEVTLPPAPPGESSPEAVYKARAVAEALAQLGPDAEPQVVIERLTREGMSISPEEVVAIRGELLKRAAVPPGPDQPPPQEARRRVWPDASAGHAPAAMPLTVAVREVMNRDVETVTPHSTLQEAAARMEALNIGLLPVCEGDRLVGMLTDRDITVRAVARGHDAFGDRVRDVMTPDVVSCYEDQDIEEAALLMKTRQIRRLAVLDRAQRLVGILSLSDLTAVPGEERLAGETLKRVSEGLLQG